MASIAVALSGGLDSACALLLLKQAGHDVVAFHALLAPQSSIPAHLQVFCKWLGVTLELVDLRERFGERVIKSFAHGYDHGLTPNPCVLCNREIKFGLLLEHARALGLEYYATGHYAHLAEESGTGRRFLAPATDESRDQTYFLSMIDPAVLARLVFPLAGLRKRDLRAIMAAAGFTYPPATESRDICFTDPRIGLEDAPGPILLRQPGEEEAPVTALAQVGTHRGLAAFTVGQRRGLDIPWREALFVREKDTENNALIVSPRQMLAMRGCIASDANLFLPGQSLPETAFVRLRYRQRLYPAFIEYNQSQLRISLQEPVFASAPGQIAAIYDENGVILAGSIIKAIQY